MLRKKKKIKMLSMFRTDGNNNFIYIYDCIMPPYSCNLLLYIKSKMLKIVTIIYTFKYF